MSNVITVEKSMTDGERRVAQALGTQVSSKDETLLWWYEPTLRDLRNGGDRVPDFVIFDDAFGLFVLEVKDWAIDQIVLAELQQWSVRKGGITRSETAPAEQARGASHILRTLMEADTRLIQAGGAHQGKAKLPVSYGAILPNITRAEASSRRLLDVHRGQHYFYKDDLESKSPVVSFMTVLRRTVKPLFAVSVIDVSLLEGLADVIDPSRRVSVIADLRSESECQEIDRLDAAQAEFARSLGDGHRILTGCAGSGKTLVVAARARFLKQVYPAWRIRVICFNAELVPHIQKLLGNTEIDLESKIVVQNFHAYAREFIGKTFERLAGDDDGSVAERTAQAFIEIAANPPPNGAYDALLIDEGQDLRPEWTNALVSLVNGKTNSVLFAASRQQNIYGVSSYKNMGISAGGRTKHLRKSYRCSAEIITLAEAFQPDPVRRPDAKVETKDSGSLFAASEQTSRRTPQFIACEDFPALCKYVCAEIARSVRAGLCDYSDIAILYTNRYLQSLEPLATALSNQFGIQHVFRKWQSGSRLMPDDDSIKMITVHGSKGLEWRIVFLLGIDDLPRPQMDLVRERSLVYVALTRAKDEIHFVSLREKGFHKDLKELGLTLV